MVLQGNCSPLNTSFDYATVETTDVDEHAACLSNWEQDYEQLSPGAFRGRLEEVRIGPIHLYRETISQAVLMHGATKPGTTTWAVAAVEQGAGWLGGHQIDFNYLVRLSQYSEFEVATRGAADVVVVSIDSEYLGDYVRRAEGIDFETETSQHQALQAIGCNVGSLRDLLMETLAVTANGSRLLEREPLRRVLLHSMCDELIARDKQLAAPIMTADVTAGTRQRVVREARQYMSEHIDEAISVVDLCEAIGVSCRTLQYSFQDVLQMSPVAYLRSSRLNGMRRDLRRGGDESVGDRCARWGFWHLSRFAAEYRRMFGELPSETLSRARSLTRRS
ncbi:MULTISPECIES: helix-turn-helix domain-containing protein [unclassified Variovorax]|uniref:helix-turn-helix domain-containing protein n=1 Tax=unclassified Variovorax TaxID=663243 RepID=UPI0032E53B17